MGKTRFSPVGCRAQRPIPGTSERLIQEACLSSPRGVSEAGRKIGQRPGTLRSVIAESLRRGIDLLEDAGDADHDVRPDLEEDRVLSYQGPPIS